MTIKQLHLKLIHDMTMMYETAVVYLENITNDFIKTLL